MPTGVITAGEIGRCPATSSIDGTNDYVPVLKADGSVQKATANQLATGARAVDGPASSTDNAFARFDGTTGLLVQNSTSTMDDSGNAAFAGTITQGTGKTDFEKFVGISDILALSAGTWAITRVAQGDYVYRKTAADDTTIIGIDITEAIRTTASKGFSLASFDYIFRNTTADLDAHSVTLDRIEYADSTAVSVNSITLTGSLGIGQDADPQIDAITVTTPAFNVTTDSKYVMEVTVDAAAGSVYDFVGVVLKFTRNDL